MARRRCADKLYADMMQLGREHREIMSVRLQAKLRETGVTELGLAELRGVQPGTPQFTAILDRLLVQTLSLMIKEPSARVG